MGRPRTDRLRQVLRESGATTMRLRRDTVDQAIKPLRQIIHTAIESGRAVIIDSVGLFIIAVEESGYLQAHVGRSDVGILAHMTVRPPMTDGDPADASISVAGLLEAIRNGRIGRDETLASSPLNLNLLECIAWAWLENSGYA